MELPDIAELTAAELTALRGRVDARLLELRETEGPILAAEMAQRAAELGLDLKVLMASHLGKKRGRKPKSNGQTAHV